MKKHLGNTKKCLTLMCAFVLLSISEMHAQKEKKVKSFKDAVASGSATSSLESEVVGIPAGTYDRNSDADTKGIRQQNQQDLVSISSFYIGATEVTNSQYKEFVNWVRDSIAAYLLGGKYLIVNKKTGDTSINWENASHIDYASVENRTKLASVLLPPTITLSHRYEFDPTKLNYALQGINYEEASKKENQGKSLINFSYRYEIPVYPDTLVWTSDFGYSNNQQMLTYFSSSKYKNYPVIGVNWKQAVAYCDWFTKQKLYKWLYEKRLPIGGVCRLPTETEWIYAATLNAQAAGVEKKKKEEQPKNSKKSADKQKSVDSASTVAIVAAADITTTGNAQSIQDVKFGGPGKYGVYGLSGNVSEWTSTSHYPGGNNFQNRFNPDVQWGSLDEPSKAKRQKVVLGGSWNVPPEFSTIKNRSYVDMNESHSYIGFRILINIPQ